jgi:hypothetical protein
MRVPTAASRVLISQSVGFGLIALLSVFNHLLDLPRLFAGNNVELSRWRYGILEVVIIFLIWAFAFSVTRRLLLRLHYLEGMLRMCAWCRKIGYKDQWITLEKYLIEGFHINTTHGICPDCLKKVEEDTKLFYRKECEAREQPAMRAARS